MRPPAQGWEIGLFGLAPATLDGNVGPRADGRVAGACLYPAVSHEPQITLPF